MRKFFRKIKEILLKCVISILTERFSLLMVWTSFIGLVCSVIIFIIFGDWSFSYILNEEKIAQFGDFVGGVIGTLLAFAASLLYYVALKEQQKDVKINQDSLNKQIEEFGKQVEELELSRQVYTDQYNIMLFQQFENNFFAYFDIYLKVKDQLDKQSEKNDYFSNILHNLSSTIKYTDLQGRNSISAYDYARNKYSLFFIKNREEFAHYFRTMYRLVTIVTSSNILKSDSEKMKYIKTNNSIMKFKP